MSANATRSADATLLGFHYQLDKTLQEILTQESDTSRITIEGIEDIDVESSDEYRAIQCKYLEASAPTPSAVRDALGLMLREYKKDPQKPWAFRLYAHFGAASPTPLDFSPEGLKKILTYRSGRGNDTLVHHLDEEIHADDNDLKAFSACFKLEIGPSFKEQRAAIFGTIQNTLNVSAAEAAEFFYCKALSIIFEFATRASSSQRSVSKAELKEKLKAAGSAFASPWLIRILGRDKALAHIRKAIKKLGVFAATKQKTLVIDTALPASGNALISLAGFIRELVEHSFCPAKSLYDAVPWTILIDTPLDQILRVKSYLLDNGVIFNDGYEHVRFTPTVFAEAPVVLRHPDKKTKATEYLGKASFRCRIATLESAGPYLNQLPIGNVLIALGSITWQHKFRSCSEISMNIGNDWTLDELLTILKG